MNMSPLSPSTVPARVMSANGLQNFATILQCTKCDRPFSNLRSLAAHVVKLHGKTELLKSCLIKSVSSHSERQNVSCALSRNSNSISPSLEARLCADIEFTRHGSILLKKSIRQHISELPGFTENAASVAYSTLKAVDINRLEPEVFQLHNSRFISSELKLIRQGFDKLFARYDVSYERNYCNKWHSWDKAAEERLKAFTLPRKARDHPLLNASKNFKERDHSEPRSFFHSDDTIRPAPDADLPDISLPPPGKPKAHSKCARVKKRKSPRTSTHRKSKKSRTVEPAPPLEKTVPPVLPKVPPVRIRVRNPPPPRSMPPRSTSPPRRPAPKSKAKSCSKAKKSSEPTPAKGPPRNWWVPKSCTPHRPVDPLCLPHKLDGSQPVFMLGCDGDMHNIKNVKVPVESDYFNLKYPQLDEDRMTWEEFVSTDTFASIARETDPQQTTEMILYLFRTSTTMTTTSLPRITPINFAPSLFKPINTVPAVVDQNMSCVRETLKTESVTPSSQLTFECPFCSKVYPSFRRVRNHQKLRHTGMVSTVIQAT